MKNLGIGTIGRVRKAKHHASTGNVSTKGSGKLPKHVVTPRQKLAYRAGQLVLPAIAFVVWYMSRR